MDATTMSQILLVDSSPRGVATLSLNRPDVSNAIHQDMIDALGVQFDRLGRDDSVRAIVVRGNGKHFSGGADVRWHGNRPAPGPDAPPPLSVFELCDRIRATPQPTIALVHGGCIGSALGIASCCDILIAAKNSFFSIPEVRIGFSPGVDSSRMFSRAIGVRNFRRYAMTGQRFSAEDALRMGLAHQLCESADLDKALADQIEEILLAAPLAQRKAKLMADALNPPLPAAVKEIEHLFANPLQTPESIEGHKSFLEKRKPNWYPRP
jgi:methylglutaconyl-CoA hydratase